MPNKIATHNGYLLIDGLPEDYWCFHITKHNEIEAYREDGGGGTKGIGWFFTLPPGNYSIVGRGLELWESQWKQIVGEHNGLFEYPDFERNELCLLRTATESGLSLIKSLGMENPLILKIES